MAITKLSDVIVPELFNPYVVNKTMELSALYQSGIIVSSPEFAKLASEAAPIHNMPFFEDLTGDAEPVIEDAELTPAKIIAVYKITANSCPAGISCKIRGSVTNRSAGPAPTFKS